MFLKFKKQQIPNILTLSRLFFIPVILIFLFVDFGPIIYSISWLNNVSNVNLSFLLSGILFSLLAFSDFLDGYLARKFNWESNFGKIWDPVADKILITSTLICFSIIGFVPWYFTIIMFARDIIVDSYRMYAATHSIIVKANLLGKLKTVTQILALVIIYFFFNVKNIDHTKLSLVDNLLIQNLFTLLATVISVLSGIYYLAIIRNKLNNKLDIIKKV